MSQQLLSQFQPIGAIATNPIAAKTLYSLCQNKDITLMLPESVENYCQNAHIYTDSLQVHLGKIWHDYRSFIFCLASGAVVRLIAPLLQHKLTDPAVVVIDPEGKFVISLCSGHTGGADQLTQIIASFLGATPVLTGASASLGLPPIDILGLPYGWQKGSGDWTGVSAAIARGEKVEVIQEVGNSLWQANLPENHPFVFDFPEDDKPFPKSARIWISPTQRSFSPHSDIPKVQWHPRVLWVGIGCERGTSQDLIAQAIAQVCRRYHLATEAIAGIATIDIKADEQGILSLCTEQNYPLKTFCASQLSSVDVPTPSTIVNQEVGTPSVAEAAAILAADSPLLVPKQIVKSEDQGALTVAIASASQEYTGRMGKLWLIGIGPGDLTQMTVAAKTAIHQADAIIGYNLYIKLISPLHRPGQILQSLPITQEKQRAERAIELAGWGLTVAVISSGDCGIYGMAGLVLEQLQASGWDGSTPDVQVFPGISALQASASKVGAPLMHDFCAISLSDLLTPFEVITQRLQAAAQADFVTIIYNPKSQKRQQQIISAQEIFLQYRDPQTPVAIVRSAYRQEEEITLTTLSTMLQSPIDMFTTVIIGNSSTRHYGDWMITPRGYQVTNPVEDRQTFG